jgi:hypothetical protein
MTWVSSARCWAGFPAASTTPLAEAAVISGLGVDVDHTLLIYLTVDRLSLPKEDIARLYDDMRQCVGAIPGARGVSLASWNPFPGGHAVGPYTREHGDDYHRYTEAPIATAVDSGFFRAIDATSLRRRDFTAADVVGAPKVAIIKEPLAELLRPEEDALGGDGTLLMH